MRREWLLAIVLTLAAGGAGAIALTRLSDPVPAPSGADGSETIRAEPRPAVDPEPVAATGACADAMNTLRGLMTSAQSGSLLDDAQNTQLTAGLDGLDTACAADDAEEFRDRELVPWLNYAPAT